MHHYITWQCMKCGKQVKKNQGPTPPPAPNYEICPNNNKQRHIWEEIEHTTK